MERVATIITTYIIIYIMANLKASSLLSQIYTLMAKYVASSRKRIAAINIQNCGNLSGACRLVKSNPLT